MRLLRSWLIGVSLAAAGLASTVAALKSQTVGAIPTPTTAGGSNTDLSGDIITFTASDFYDNRGAPYAEDSVYADTQSNNVQNGAGKSFGFTVSSAGVNITGAQLRDSMNGTVIGSATPTSGSGSGFKRDADQVSIVLTVATATGSDEQTGTIVIPATGHIFDNGYEGQPLYFEINWVQGSTSGSSYSRNFTFVHEAVVSSFLPMYTDTNPVLPETRAGGSATAALSTATETATTGAKTAGATASATGGTSLSSPHSHKSSLSGGAIAGIVIGAVAALAIIAGLIFFVYRRRRNSDGGRNAYNPALLAGSVEPYRGAGRVPDLGGDRENLHGGIEAGAADNLMAEKDGGVDGAASRDGGPHSPYSDEDGTQIIPPRPATEGGAAVAPAAVATVAAPPAIRAANVSPSASPAPAAAQPAGSGAVLAPVAAPVIPGQVAALIEDHMTPEDVARLEAEERELDADIENAIRNRAAAGSR